MGIYLELIALVWFLVCWLGYTEYSKRKANDRPCLSNTLDLYREDWMRVMLRRDNRISDASVVGNLERNGAFFKFTWSMRMYNFVAVLIGSAPLTTDTKASPASREAFARSAGQVCNMAGDAFNLGLRSYYYALAVVSWFIHPVVFMAASTLVVIVLYRREFRSAALLALRSGKVFEEPAPKQETDKETQS
ncbi:DUF599 domain-containing protein [Marinobacter sp.]|uniref:DUF599 domain-containing protein n=2 Tax=Marinobacter sp. TaxID=50741 RepID=UPI003568DDD3